MFTYTHVNAIHRPKWIKIYGTEFHPSEFILCGKQIDDLPTFEKIKEILVIQGFAMFYVEKFLTTGLCNHLLCYAVSRTHMFEVVPASSILDKSTFSAHTFLGDGQLYIAMHSDVVL